MLATAASSWGVKAPSAALETTVLAQYLARGRMVEEAEKLFDAMRTRGAADVQAYSVMVSGLARARSKFPSLSEPEFVGKLTGLFAECERKVGSDPLLVASLGNAFRAAPETVRDACVDAAAAAESLDDVPAAVASTFRALTAADDA